MDCGTKLASSIILSISIIIYWYNSKLEDDLKDRMRSVLSSMLAVEAKHQAGHSPRVAVGYGACQDLVVSAKFMVENETFPASPQNYLQIDNKQQLLEMFAYFFENGAAAERFVSSDQVFEDLVATATKTAHYWIQGGNAPTMASRFASEGATVLLAAKMTEKYKGNLPAGVEVAGGLAEEDDIHLVWDYKDGDTWGGITAPRANRFIIHSDHNNPRIGSLESFKDQLPLFQPELLVVSGLQMMDSFPFKEGERLERIGAIRQQMVDVGVDTRVHFEMASFVDTSLLVDLGEHIIPYADSLGMNEQELPNLHSLLLEGKVTEVSNSNPRIAVVLDQMRDIYKLLSTDKGWNRPLTRIHLHTLAYQAILIKKGSAWKSNKLAAVKASLTANRHVCANKEISVDKSFLIMDDSFATSSKEGAIRVPFDKSNPTACWEEENLGVSICLAPMLVCKEAVQTAGGGDNISAAGLVVQL